MKIPVKIVTGDNQATGGLADAKMLKPFASEVVRVPDDLAASLVCGGLLPMTQAEYDKLGASVTPPAFTPLELFAAGEQGAWYDPSDLSTMFQDAAGLSPVTAVEQAVGAVLDKRSAPYSAFFDGTGDYLQIANNSNLGLPSGDFTFETWVYPTSINALYTPIAAYALTDVTFASDLAYICYISGGNKIIFNVYVGSTKYSIASTSNISTNAWTHIAAVRSSNTLTLYVNGTSVSTVTISGTINDNTNLVYRIGGHQEGATFYYFNGYISNLRLVKGTAVYTAAFTPPTSSLTAISNTSLLTCGNSWSSNPTITRNGDVYAHGRNPFVAMIGNHARQATSASRPTLSARYNLLTYSEQFDNAAWTKSNVTASSNTDTAPDGASTGDTLAATASNGTALSSYTAVATDYTFSVWLKRKTGTGNVDISAHSGGTWVTQTITSSWARYSVTQTMTAGAKTPGIRIATSGDEVYAWGAQLIVANDLTSNAYQRIAAATNYDSDAAKFPYYLKFDGTDDCLVTNSVDFTSTDKMTVVCGTRKLSDSAGIVVELGPNATQTYIAFYLLAGEDNSARYTALSGPVGVGVWSIAKITAGYAPDTAVLSVALSVPDDLVRLRRSGVNGTDGTGDFGSGNFINNALYIGARNQSAFRFNGRIYGLIVRGASTTDALISSTESYVAGKTGVTL